MESKLDRVRAAKVPSPLPPPPPPQSAEPSGSGESGGFGESAQRVIGVDLGGVSTGFEPLPIGNYPSVVDEVTHFPHSKKSGKPYIHFVFKVTDPQTAAGRKLFMNCSLQPDALWKLAQALDALGVTVPDGHLELDLDSLVGLSCVVSVGVGSYGGKPKNEIVDVMPSPTGGAPSFAAPV